MPRQKSSAKSNQSASVGRPRSWESKQAILTAAWKLLQTYSVRKVSIEAVAREAGVGKTTIYRWWPSKAAVIVDAFLAQVEPSLPFPKTDTASASLALQMRQVVKILSGDVGRIVAQIIAEGQCDPEALGSFCDRFLKPRRNAARHIILQGIESGEFAPDIDPNLAMDILYGPIYYRLLVKHLPLDEAFAAALHKQAIVSILKP
ncbi:TetR/AcrR family transcriptional regulator [Leptolyngbyaceae cyanobacterium CCMR0082]|uniref:TetR/AcrR family transcriptional regulator n=1 Tax=Adonisia turfae CCMR0082 TaxID=2304604 RepID=A0A6M0S6A7_9CYAN|nr:TetR/AcrR family transcriptional regulator [Adonisia turfae]NEZ64019.1 TetR/AcrR family transcriptional regulator [Adonisia turfae CCMR0082]